MSRIDSMLSLLWPIFVWIFIFHPVHYENEHATASLFFWSCGFIVLFFHVFHLAPVRKQGLIDVHWLQMQTRTSITIPNLFQNGHESWKIVWRIMASSLTWNQCSKGNLWPWILTECPVGLTLISPCRVGTMKGVGMVNELSIMSLGILCGVLHVVSINIWVSSGSSSFLLLSKNMPVGRLVTLTKVWINVQPDMCARCLEITRRPIQEDHDNTLERI